MSKVYETNYVIIIVTFMRGRQGNNRDPQKYRVVVRNGAAQQCVMERQSNDSTGAERWETIEAPGYHTKEYILARALIEITSASKPLTAQVAINLGVL